MKKILIGLAAVVAIGAAALWQFQGSAQAAPDVAFTDLNGHTVTTQDLRGKVVLVKFWATSCTTCVAQMPDTIRHYQELKSRGFDTIGVAMQYDPPNIAQAFGDVRLTPTAFLIDKQGHIIKRYLGNYDEKAFMATVEQALAS